MGYTQEQIDRANQVNLEQFLRSQGEQLIKLQMLKPNDREYAMSTCLIFIEGLEARKEVV